MTEPQLDIYGNAVPVEEPHEPPSYAVEKPKPTPMRLFEPQVEGQLTLEWPGATLSCPSPPRRSAGGFRLSGLE